MIREGAGGSAGKGRPRKREKGFFWGGRDSFFKTTRNDSGEESSWGGQERFRAEIWGILGFSCREQPERRGKSGLLEESFLGNRA